MTGVNYLPSWESSESFQPANFIVSDSVNVPDTIVGSLGQGLTAWKTRTYNLRKADRNVLATICMGIRSGGTCNTQGTNGSLT